MTAKSTAKKKPAAKCPREAQPAFVLKVAPPKLTAAAKQAAPSAVTIAQLQALAAAGILPGVSKSAAAGGFDIAELLKIYQQFKPLIDMLLPLLQGLFKKADTPVPVPEQPTPKPAPDVDEPGEEVGPAPPDAERSVGRLEAKVFWITRKRQPSKAGGGRYLLSDEGKQRIVSGSDPLQAGDRVCFDVSPYDTQGVKYEGPKPCDLEHVVGGVGELQQQEENDYTPVVFAPWEGASGQPGFQGTISYQAKGCGFETKTITLRVRPWKA